MINDALNGKIDLILTKSVSRFARNTVDALTTVRSLREKGVEVYFEKENIYTLDSKGELLLTILSSLAQTESQNISSNTAWGIRKGFADGKVSITYSNFLGYELGSDGKPQINEEEAKVVRRIYEMFLLGYTYEYIARTLTLEGVPTPKKKKRWFPTCIFHILTNEKYIGDSILQKTFSVDVLTKKRKVNEGELPQYYVENNHPAIISDETFEMVREEIERRKQCGQMIYVSHFSGRIQCGDSGAYYGRKVWHSNEPYQSTVWHCNNKFKKQNHCNTPTIKEKAIEDCFINAFNQILLNKQEIINNYDMCLEAITDDSEYVKLRDELDKKCDLLAETIKDFLAKCSKAIEDSALVNAKYEAYIKELEELQKQRQNASLKIASCSAKRVKVKTFLDLLSKQDSLLTTFDSSIWQVAVNKMIIYHDLSVKFLWRDGSETMTKIERGIKTQKMPEDYKYKRVEVPSNEVCLNCGTPLFMVVGKQKKMYCCKECRDEYYRKHKKRKY